MRITNLSIENFTIFKNENFKFSTGLNIIIGENDTGKSHLLRLLYSLIESNNLVIQQKGDNKRYLLQKSIPQKLIDIFKPEELANLIKNGQDKTHIICDFNKYSIKFNFTHKTKIQVNINKNDAPASLIKQDLRQKFFRKKLLPKIVYLFRLKKCYLFMKVLCLFMEHDKYLSMKLIII